MVSAFYRVHRAGPRKEIYYEPEEVKAAIVTCGGLCPGLNDVIRQVLFFQYYSSDLVSSRYHCFEFLLRYPAIYGAIMPVKVDVFNHSRSRGQCLALCYK